MSEVFQSNRQKYREHSKTAEPPTGGGGNKDTPQKLVRFDAIESQLHRASDRVALFASDHFRTSLFERVQELLQPEGVLSLDVFDTLLLRDNSCELSRFMEIGELMAREIGAIEPIEGFLARHFGTKASYRAGKRVDGCREGSLTEIHRTASRLLCQDDSMAETFVELELEYEQGRLRPNSLLLDLAAFQVSRGGKVILLSDMYLHADQIRRLLAKLDLRSDLFALIHSSADSKVSKASGGVFERVANQLGEPKHRFLHLGDSLTGDFQRPRAHGWAAIHLPVPRRDVDLRREDHRDTVEFLRQQHGVAVDVAWPH